MPKDTIRLLIPVALAAQLAAGAAPAAAGGSPHDAFYRCKNAKGESFVGQAIPEECLGADIEVLDQRSHLLRVIPGQRSTEQVNQQQADADAKTAAAQRDRTLLATYLSVADIERLRDQRLELLEQQAFVTHQYIQNLRARQARLMQDVQRYRPYSPNANAPALPDTVAEELVNTVNGLQVYEQELAKNTVEQQRLRRDFGADIARFKELKGLQ